MRSRAHYAELVFYKAYADLRAESERTYVGFLWWFIDPLVNMLVFYFVFAFVLQRGTADYIPFLLSGMVVWKWFGSTITVGAGAIPANAGLTRQVHVPKIVFPLVTLLVNTVKFAIALVLLLVFFWIYGYEPTIHYAALPVILLVEGLFIFGTTIVVCALVPFFPDLVLLLENVLRVAFFLSGIFFPASQVPESVRRYFYLNPMVTIIESCRDATMHARWPSWSALGIVAAFSIGMMLFGWGLLRRFDRSYGKSLA